MRGSLALPAATPCLAGWKLSETRGTLAVSARGPPTPGSGARGARTRPRQSGGARPSPVQPEGPGRVQRDTAGLRLQRRQSLAERLASPGGRGSRGQRHVLRRPGRGQADPAPSSLPAPAPPRPAPRPTPTGLGPAPVQQRPGRRPGAEDPREKGRGTVTRLALQLGPRTDGRSGQWISADGVSESNSAREEGEVD